MFIIILAFGELTVMKSGWIYPSGRMSYMSSRPFVTIGKPTCGPTYRPETDHKKRRIGIPPTNIVKSRPKTAPLPAKM